jgi:hypothetical protein
MDFSRRVFGCDDNDGYQANAFTQRVGRLDHAARVSTRLVTARVSSRSARVPSVRVSSDKTVDN